MNNENLPQSEPGFEHPLNLESLENIKSVSQRADELLLAEKFAEAEQLYRELCRGLEVLLGPTHADLAEAKHKLAAALGGQGKTEEAIESEEKAKIIQSVL